ncbi:ANKRD50 [Symbiodinium sp. CCMP2592]|nr:ANKRD50 [Symbiodinium sp. CCMP2592]
MLLAVVCVSASLPGAAATSQLLHAAYWGWLEEVERLVNQRAALEERDWLGKTPLAYAAWQGRVEVAQYLLQQGAAVDAKDKDGETPLALAARYGQSRLVDLLVAHGADVRAKTEDGQSVLALAALQGHGEVVEDLLQRRAQAETRDRNGRTPLALAATFGHLSVVRQLLTTAPRGGGEPPSEAPRSLVQRQISVDSQDNLGFTPLASASWAGHADVASFLLRKGADPKGRTDAQDPLVLAATNGHAKVAAVLQRAGARLDLQAEAPQTGLPMWAQASPKARTLGLVEPTFVWHLGVLVGQWETHVAVLGGLFLSLLLALSERWLQGEGIVPDWGPPKLPLAEAKDAGQAAEASSKQDAFGCWIDGARLLAAGAQKPSGQRLLLRCRRLLEAWANVTISCSWGFLVVFWPYWAALVLLAFLGPAVFQFSAAALLRRPSLIFGAAGLRGEALAAMRLLLLLLLLALTGDPLEGVGSLDAPAREGVWDALFAPSYVDFQGQSLENIRSDGRPLAGLGNHDRRIFARAAGWWPKQTLGGVDLLSIVHGYEIVSLFCVACFPVLLLWRAVSSALQKDEGTKADSEQIARQILQDLPVTESGCQGLLEGVRARLFLLGLDPILQLSSIWVLLVAGSFSAAGLLVAVWCRCLWKLVLYKSPRKIVASAQESMKQGILHRDVVELVVDHGGFQACFCLAIVSHSFFFSVLDVPGAFALLLNMAVSAHSAASFLYEHVDLQAGEGPADQALEGREQRTLSEESEASVRSLLNTEPPEDRATRSRSHS